MNMKRIFNMGMALVLLVTSFAVSQPVAAVASESYKARFDADAQAAPGELVVAFANSEGKTLVEKIEQAVETANDANGEVTRLSVDGNAVIRVDGNVAAAAADLNNQPGVLYAEPNYIYSVPKVQSAGGDFSVSSDYVFHRVTPNAHTNFKSVMALPRSTIESMVAMGTYPTDTYLTINQGWFAMGADIVWPNTTASAGVCEIDTGVDIKHPDLGTSTVKNVLAGYDFVNADINPADDNGHGTHVAGIMVAVKNNKIGVSGISTGKVVAVKALDAQGNGTNFDVALAIQYCASRSDIRVINMSLAGPQESSAIHDALVYATTPTTVTISGGPFNGKKGKGKLVVVSAGNDNSQTPTYPAGYADTTLFPEFQTNRILSVGASGWPDGANILYECRATFSNYGASWVNVSAPGLDIYSTTPYDKPFYKNSFDNVNTRYDFLSGTSMAAAFVSASAARRMGYKPGETSEQVAQAIIDTGDSLDPDCTENEMLQAKRVNVAALLDRTAVNVSVFDAATGSALNGATVYVTFKDAGVASSRKSVMGPEQFKLPAGDDPDPNRIFSYYLGDIDILDIPTKDKNGAPILEYQIKVNKTGYTNGSQPVFLQEGPGGYIPVPTPGIFSAFLNGAVPPKSAGFDIVLGWNIHKQDGYQELINANDLDLYVWLPEAPGAGLVANFIVGYGGDSFGYVEGDPFGTLNAFPYARLKREGGFLDGGPKVESITILNRAAYGTSLGTLAPAAPAFPAPLAPYYGGTYTVLATDYGQIIDHDEDGCGDNFGYDYDPAYTPGGECTGKTAGIPLLGAYFTPYVYVWKDGVKQFFAEGSNNYGPWGAGTECNKHWWKALEINSPAPGLTSAPTYDATFAPPIRCDNGASPDFIPYVATPGSGERITLSGLGK